MKQIQWKNRLAKSWRVLGAFVLIFSFAPSEQTHDRGRLIYTDYIDNVYLYNFEQNSPQLLGGQGGRTVIDENLVFISTCLRFWADIACVINLRQIVQSQDAERFNRTYKFWQDDYDAPVWSPDGRTIAFVKYVFEPDSPYPKRYNFHLINADGTDVRDPTPEEDNDGYRYSWSPDSREIAYLCGGENYFCIVNADATNLRKIEVEASGDIYELAWSPDGSLIASLLYYDDPRHYELYIMNSDGSNPHLLWDTEMQIFYSTWSPNSTRLVLEARDLNNNVNKRWTPAEIYVINVDGSNLHNLTNTESAYEYSPAWSPDSSQIAYLSENGGTSVYILDVDGESSPQLIHADLPYATDSPNPSLFWIP